MAHVRNALRRNGRARLPFFMEEPRLLAQRKDFLVRRSQRLHAVHLLVILLDHGLVLRANHSVAKLEATKRISNSSQ